MSSNGILRLDLFERDGNIMLNGIVCVATVYVYDINCFLRDFSSLYHFAQGVNGSFDFGYAIIMFESLVEFVLNESHVGIGSLI